MHCPPQGSGEGKPGAPDTAERGEHDHGALQLQASSDVGIISARQSGRARSKLMSPQHHGWALRHRHQILVTSDMIDELGHVNNAVYLRWVQEAISHFWQKTARPEDLARIVWVAFRHEITYRRPTFEAERVDIELWVADYAGPRAIFELRIGQPGDVRAEVTSTLCCLDRSTRKLVRVTGDLAGRFFA